MSTDDGITEMIEYIKKYVLHDLTTQVEWHTCTRVNWETKTMDSKEVASETELFDVYLGMGSMNVRPKVGSKCLVGMIENHNGIGFLIYAQEAEAIELVAGGVKVEVEDGKIKLNGDTYSSVKAETLQKELNKTKAVVDTLVQVLSNWTVAGGDGGAALQLLIKSSLAPLTTGDYSNIKNDTVKHG